ncbi:uncharacterized protein ColSpa_04287 [Colletotrichum spaethianum]|uniref:GDS1 winged helix domain-containing protein n=1 Tax=Colletotrichum spaethianum TaxID=700344 RepID=A0AA37P5L6_9PEZI|nr:uncharacterized protein ColSpa_04287 [Colletotrichum spaethianum]GKT44106.1 hypothetical protein ColSpa_04287 [Colletotrichum spaethianum]
MPYNTRRKSLSLPSLGIHVPGSHSSRSPATATSNRAISENLGNRITVTSTSTSHPNKRQKRSHGEEGPQHRCASHKRPDEQVMFDHTPPPSPTPDSIGMQDATSDVVSTKQINLDGIHDEIVEAVIVHSANPCAIISSRLAAYLKRSCWSALAPCPLGKELETIHPRRTYFYLTTCSRQPFPDSPAYVHRAVISPSLSSIASGSEDGDDVDLRRRELSPSPEVDLSSPEFDDGDDDFAMPTTPVGSLPNNLRYSRSHRSASPPLEKDEREFTQTADVLQKRKLARELSSAGNVEQSTSAYESARDDGMFEEKHGATVGNGLVLTHQFITSPTIKATAPSSARKETDGDSWFKLGNLLEWDHSPENIELDELDCLLDSC